MRATSWATPATSSATPRPSTPRSSSPPCSRSWPGPPSRNDSSSAIPATATISAPRPGGSSPTCTSPSSVQVGPLVQPSLPEIPARLAHDDAVQQQQRQQVRDRHERVGDVGGGPHDRQRQGGADVD